MRRIDLNGPWVMADESGRELPCTVPGSVAACLLEHGLIDDPYVMDNEQRVVPVFEKDYTFRRAFTVTADDLAHDRLRLCCEGLDTIARVSINGRQVLYADNMHRTWIAEVKPCLRVGENHIAVHFTSPLRYIREHPARTGKRFATIRKAACMFGWDWGIKLPDSGIWRDIYIQGQSKAALGHIQIGQVHSGGEVALNISAQAELLGAHAVQIEVLVRAPDSREVFSGTKTVGKSGKAAFTCAIQSPQLWWPVGYGAQPLYTVTTRLVCHGTELGHSEQQIGLRTLRLDRTRRQDGSNYGFVVNGKPIFFRGENLVIEDAILGRTTPGRWERLIDNCLRSNLNGVRVWGGAYYPPDCFYQLCDRHGLMVFQDFMFACTFYATPKAFVDNVRHEVADNLMRMAHHPCIALYCGNNELDCIYTVMTSDEPETAALRRLFGGGDKLGFLVRAVAWGMYKKLFLRLIPALCRKLAPETSYVHSSPSTSKPRGAKSFFDYLSDGDMHYYLQYNDNAPYEKLRDFRVRFMTEMGFQSYPALKTIEAFADAGSRSPYSPIMYAHQKCKDGNEAIELYMEREYKIPKDFSQYVYLSQLQAGEIMRYSIEHLRRDSAYCRGMIIWQMNDCWPVVSWSGIDYFGRWKGQQYYTKRVFAPVLASADVHDGSAALWVTNDSPDTVTGVLRWALRSVCGETLGRGEAAVTSPPGSSGQILCIPYRDMLPQARLDSAYLEFELADARGCLSAGKSLLVRAKAFRFTRPCLTLDITDGPEAYCVSVTSDCFAKGVVLDLTGGDCLFSDNFFDLSANETRVITIPKPHISGVAGLDSLRRALTVGCLNSVMLDHEGQQA